MPYTTNPGSGGPTFGSDQEGGSSVPHVAADERRLKRITDEASATITYICEAAIGSSLAAAVWRIRRITVNGSLTTEEWAGTGAFDQVANNRTALSYS